MNDDLSNDLESIKNNLIPSENNKKEDKHKMTEDEEDEKLIEEYVDNLSPYLTGILNSLFIAIVLCLGIKIFAYSMISWTGIIFLAIAYISLCIIITIQAIRDINMKKKLCK